MTNFSATDVNFQKDEFPKEFLHLFSVIKVKDVTEALSIFLHTCMLNVGFIPVDIPETEVYECLPEGWNIAGAFKFQYCHKTCRDSFCWMTCVPLYSNIAVHGTLDSECSQNAYFSMKVPEYLNSQADLTAVEKIFIQSKDLIRKFKDEFCYPLLALLQESASCDPSFGFSITVDEIKLYLFKLLPIQSILSLSCVNKDFSRVASSPHLWKFLIRRDFGLIDTSISSENYKEIYKREYLKKIQKVRRRSFPFAEPFYVPRLPTIYPPDPSYIDPRIDLDPAIQQAFPNLRDRIRPRNWYPLHPWGNFPGNFMNL